MLDTEPKVAVWFGSMACETSPCRGGEGDGGGLCVWRNRHSAESLNPWFSADFEGRRTRSPFLIPGPLELACPCLRYQSRSGQTLTSTSSAAAAPAAAAGATAPSSAPSWTRSWASRPSAEPPAALRCYPSSSPWDSQGASSTRFWPRARGGGGARRPSHPVCCRSPPGRPAGPSPSPDRLPGLDASQA
jgi:hypothetical protein